MARWSPHFEGVSPAREPGDSASPTAPLHHRATARSLPYLRTPLTGTLTKKAIPIFLGIALLLVILFAVGATLRVGEVPNINAISDSLKSGRTRASMFGHISEFSQWFQESWDEDMKPAFGAYTIAGLFNLSGLHTRYPGLYIEKSYEVEPGASTNIYTIFRGLIQDFTLPGSIVIADPVSWTRIKG